MKLQVGMKVKIKEDVVMFLRDAGKVKTVTKILSDFNGNRAFALDGDEGIWVIDDFKEFISYPHLSIE